MPEWSGRPPRHFGGITGAEDGLALTTSPVAGPCNGKSNGSVNVLVDSGASGHYFDDVITPGLRDNLDSYQVLDVAQNHNHRWGTSGRHCAGTAQWHRRRRQRSAAFGPTLVFGCVWPTVQPILGESSEGY